MSQEKASATKRTGSPTRSPAKFAFIMLLLVGSVVVQVTQMYPHLQAQGIPGPCFDISTGTGGANAAVAVANAPGTKDNLWTVTAPPIPTSPVTYGSATFIFTNWLTSTIGPYSINASTGLGAAWLGGPAHPDPHNWVGLSANWIFPYLGQTGVYDQTGDKWPIGLDAPAGNYVYSTTFNVPWASGGTLTIEGWTSDNAATVTLTSQSGTTTLDINPGDFQHWRPQVTSPVLFGSNTLSVTVNNIADTEPKTGLLVKANVCAVPTTSITTTTTLTCVNGTIDLNTGTTVPFQADAAGITDPHWVVTNLPSGPVSQHPYSVTPPQWFGGLPVGPGPGRTTNWVSPNVTYNDWPGGPSGSYNYSITFTVPGTSTLQISGYAADNNVWLYLDGNPIPSAFDNSASGTAFTSLHTPITQTVPSGPHILSAGVDNNHPANGPSPTGLIVIASATCGGAPSATTITTWDTERTFSTATALNESTTKQTVMTQTTITSTQTGVRNSTTTWTRETGVPATYTTTIKNSTTSTSCITVGGVISCTATTITNATFTFTHTVATYSLVTYTSTIVALYTTAATSTQSGGATVTQTFTSSSTITTVISSHLTTLTSVVTTSTSALPPTSIIITTAPASSTSASTTPSGPSGSQCIIATAAYGSELAGPIQFLRNFRDNEVQKTTLGAHFMAAFNRWYYSWAPTIAQQIAPNENYKATTRMLISPLIGTLYLSHMIFAAMAPASPELAILSAGLLTSAILGLIYLTPAYALAWRLSKRRIGKRTICNLAIAAAILTFIATLTTGTFNAAANLTALTVVETMLLTPAFILRKMTSPTKNRATT